MSSERALAKTLCASSLWQIHPSTQVKAKRDEAIAILTPMATKWVKAIPKPIENLHSAGEVDVNTKEVTASRRAFLEADAAAVLALMHALTQDPKYLAKTREFLLAWAKVYKRSGHPVNENRLAGLLWAYDLTRCYFSVSERETIDAWLKKWRAEKGAWQFGPKTAHNNHFTHHLKIIMLLDKLLKQTDAFGKDRKVARMHACINLLDNGESLDYHERDAIYYHHYDLQSWLEIELLSQCCTEKVKKAFVFLKESLESPLQHAEFVQSSAPIDRARARRGVPYAEAGSHFQVAKAAATFQAAATIFKDQTIQAPLAHELNDAKPSPWLAFVSARRVLW